MKNMMKYNSKGFVLVLSLLSAYILLILMIPYISRVVTDYRLTSRIYNSTVALDLAEAGAERALVDSSFNGLATLDSMGDYYVERSLSSGGIATIKSTGYVPNKLSYNTRRTINITYVKRGFRKAIRAIGDGPGAITLGTQDKIDSYNSDNGTYAQTHTNSHGDIATNGSIVFGTQAKVYGDANPGANYPFPSKPSNVYGAWGTLQAPLALDQIPQLTLNGGVVAAQSIHDGLPAATDPPSYTLVGHDLTVLDQKTVNLPGGIDSDHPAIYYFTSITLNTQAKINVTGPSTIYVQKIADSGGNINIGLQGKLNLNSPSGATETIAIYMNRGGAYTKSGNINILTQGDINIGNVTTPIPPAKAIFYVDGGDINVGTQGGINNKNNNNPGKPKDLSIYSSGLAVSLTTQTDFSGAIYAPNAAVLLTTQGEIFGSVACKTVSAGTQAAIHFDLALLNESEAFGSPNPSNGVTSWQETQ